SLRPPAMKEPPLESEKEQGAEREILPERPPGEWNADNRAPRRGVRRTACRTAQIRFCCAEGVYREPARTGRIVKFVKAISQRLMEPSREIRGVVIQLALPLSLRLGPQRLTSLEWDRLAGGERRAFDDTITGEPLEGV